MVSPIVRLDFDPPGLRRGRHPRLLGDLQRPSPTVTACFPEACLERPRLEHGILRIRCNACRRVLRRPPKRKPGSLPPASPLRTIGTPPTTRSRSVFRTAGCRCRSRCRSAAPECRSTSAQPHLDPAAVAVIALDVEAPVVTEPFVDLCNQILNIEGRTGERCDRKRRRSPRNEVGRLGLPVGSETGGQPSLCPPEPPEAGRSTAPATHRRT